MDNEFSDYIVFADESGDHQLTTGYDENSPIFTLAFCIFRKSDYANKAISEISDLKFSFWGHDLVILHSHKIRKQTFEFAILANLPTSEKFIEKINNTIAKVPFTIVATAIDKRRLKTKYTTPSNPYNLGLLFCLERTSKFLEQHGQKNKLTHIIVEARGKKEDKELELEFRRILTQSKGLAKFDIIFADKKVNSAGLQICDLVAHPIGRHIIKPEQNNRAYEIIEQKLHRYPNHDGKGLKIFPK